MYPDGVSVTAERSTASTSATSYYETVSEADSWDRGQWQVAHSPPIESSAKPPRLQMVLEQAAPHKWQAAVQESRRVADNVCTLAETVQREAEVARRAAEGARRVIQGSQRTAKETRWAIEETRRMVEEIQKVVDETRRSVEDTRRSVEETRWTVEQTRRVFEESRAEFAEFKLQQVLSKRGALVDRWRQGQSTSAAAGTV